MAKHAGGRPSKFDEKFIKQVEDLALLGMTDEQMSHFFEVTTKTFDNWKKQSPEFLRALKKGRDDADTKVVRSLYERANGYNCPEDKIFIHNGEPVIVPTIKHYPPDVTAQIFWLKNRQKQLWRDRIDAALTDPDGGPLTVVVRKFCAAKDAPKTEE